MIDLLTPLLAVEEGGGPADPSNVGVGSVVLTVAMVLFLIWAGYLILNSRRRKRAAEETPANLQPYVSDDELENNRITRVLNVAVVSAAVLAIAMPVYFLNEADRQEAAAEKISEKDVEEGEHWYTTFSCINCHGPEGGGGAAPFVEARSGLDVAWTAPSINDVFLRYSEEEVRHWIEFGRAGTPMPASGLEGGGAMTVQEVDQVIEYLKSFQIPQGEAVDEVEGLVESALARIDRGGAVVDRLLIEQQAARADLEDAPARFAVIEDFPNEIDFLLAGDGTCTDASAALVGSSCGSAGTDTDRDGITDEAEARLTEIGATVDETLLVRMVVDQTDEDGAPVLDEEGNRVPEVVFVEDSSVPGMYGLRLDPANAFTNEDLTGMPVPDLDRVETFRLDFDTAHLQLGVINERQDVFLQRVEDGIDFLETSKATEAWDVDFTQVAADTGLSETDAERAVGLFNAYCARCHTAGYQAGVAFEQGPGTGAWGPSLLEGRSVVQFPDPADQVSFIVNGSEANENYGINGLGSGRMPGFGAILSVEDIELVVAYERAME